MCSCLPGSTQRLEPPSGGTPRRLRYTYLDSAGAAGDVFLFFSGLPAKSAGREGVLVGEALGEGSGAGRRFAVGVSRSVMMRLICGANLL